MIDFSSFSSITSKAIIENANTQIDAKELEQLLIIRNTNGGFITTTFEGLYFDREDNIFLDNVRANIDFLEDEYKKAIANPYNAAQYGYIDDVIEPRNTRFRIIRALQLLQTKKLSNPAKKHDNLPL